VTDADVFPWAHLDAIEVARIEALPFESAVYALLDAASPRASGKDLASLEWPEPKPTPATFKRLIAEWKAARALGRVAEDEASAQANLPARVRITQMLHEAIALKNVAEIRTLCASLAQLDKAAQEKPQDTTEDWTRLTDAEAGVLIALVRKLNGEPPTEIDSEWLSSLR
jgi:hypothetical protein